MTSCYFCHRPVFTADVTIQLRVPCTSSASGTSLVEEGAHEECIESARSLYDWSLERARVRRELSGKEIGDD
jgi:hypothetical protein